MLVVAAVTVWLPSAVRFRVVVVPAALIALSSAGVVAVALEAPKHRKEIPVEFQSSKDAKYRNMVLCSNV